jgi:hypothetical protein
MCVGLFIYLFIYYLLWNNDCHLEFVRKSFLEQISDDSENW